MVNMSLHLRQVFAIGVPGLCDCMTAAWGTRPLKLSVSGTDLPLKGPSSIERPLPHLTKPDGNVRKCLPAVSRMELHAFRLLLLPGHCRQLVLLEAVQVGCACSASSLRDEWLEFLPQVVGNSCCKHADTKRFADQCPLVILQQAALSAATLLC